MLAIAIEAHQGDVVVEPILEVDPDMNEEEAQDLDKNPIGLQDGEGLVEEKLTIPNDNEGIIIVPEDNLVSEEEYFVENEDESEDLIDADPPNTSVEEEVIVADIDNSTEQGEPVDQGRPRRANAGAGVERFQIDVNGKGYGAKREFSFVVNGKSEKVKSEDKKQHTYM